MTLEDKLDLFKNLLTEMKDWASAHADIDIDTQSRMMPDRVRAGVFLMLYRSEACSQLDRLNRKQGNPAEVEKLIVAACPCMRHAVE